MEYGFARAYAKLNLTLDVLSRREDGYHDLEMVMQSVSLFDSVAVRVGCGGDITSLSNVRHIPNDERNIAVKAARAFISASEIDFGGICITMEKRIPSSAGMAGGSADGAAVLRLLNELGGRPFSDKELCEIGVGVGADIPFCLLGGTSLARAKGEDLRELSPLPDCFIVIAKPRKGMSTKVVFAEIDSCPIPVHPDTVAMLAAIEKGDLKGVAGSVYNVFEPVVSVEVPEIADIKKTMCDNGALCSAMTGSGSAVFGIFEDEASARAVRNFLFAKYSDSFIVRPVPSETVRRCEWTSVSN